MIKFLQKNLPLCNKTNCIQICVGDIISNNIVDIKLKRDHIEKIIYYLKHTLNLDTPTFQTVYEYRYGNEIYTKSNNELITSSYQIMQSLIEDKHYVRVIEYNTDNLIPQSIEEYDDKSVYEIMVISNNGMFEFEIRRYLSQNYYTFMINIKKPNSFTIIYNILKDMEKLFD
jgi:hypothetical protein